MTDRHDGEPRFSQIFDDNFEAIRAYCLRRLSADDAHDATSEVFLVAWRRIETVPDGSEARLWLFGVARNTVRTFERTTRRSLRLRARLNGYAATATAGPETQVVASFEYQRIMTAFDRLSRNDQEVLRLRLWEDFNVSEISEVLGCSQKAASKRYLRALARLERNISAPNLRLLRPRLVARGGGL